MAKYQKYAEYQDSGLEWLGSIPSHWEVWKLNHFAPIITCGVAATPEYKIVFLGSICKFLTDSPSSVTSFLVAVISKFLVI